MSQGLRSISSNSPASASVDGPSRAERTQRAFAGLGRLVSSTAGMVATGGTSMIANAAGVAGGIAGAGEAGSMDQVRAMNAESQAFQMEYLQIQQQVQDDNRRFSLLTNVMRSHHETTKSAIQNIRS